MLPREDGRKVFFNPRSDSSDATLKVALNSDRKPTAPFPVPSRDMISELSRRAAVTVGLPLVLAALCLATVRADSPAGTVGLPADGPAPACPPTACLDPDVWSVSTRCLPRICHPVADADFRVERRDAPGCWNPAAVEDLTATDRPVVFFIHGNRYDAAAAKRQAVALARRLGACRPDAFPVRTVVFSWPSESRGAPLREARDNFVRAESDGHYFAALLSKFPPEADLGIVSYSFGSKISLVALDDLAAADPDRKASRSGYLGVVLVTPAVRVDSLSPCGRHHAAIQSVDRLTIFTNPKDEALRFFPFVDPSGSQAAGYVGIPSRWVPGDVAFVQIDASPIVGKEHSMQCFIDSWPLACRIAAGAIE